MGRTIRKEERQHKLYELLTENPFLTDDELADNLGVSVQTIRLDRLKLGIPELRERVKQLAAGAGTKLKSLSGEEVVGELLDLELGVRGISILEITPEMILEKAKAARGHLLFAQANSLAVAVIDAELALTVTAQVKFKRPVGLGEKVVAKAQMTGQKGNRCFVLVCSTVDREEVFSGEFVVYARRSEEEFSDAHSS